LLAGAVLRWGRGALAPDSLVASQIQKLADRSDMISEAPKCSKIQFFRGSVPDPAQGAHSASTNPLTDREGAPCPLPRTRLVNEAKAEARWNEAEAKARFSGLEALTRT